MVGSVEYLGAEEGAGLAFELSSQTVLLIRSSAIIHIPNEGIEQFSYTLFAVPFLRITLTHSLHLYNKCTNSRPRAINNNPPS